MLSAETEFLRREQEIDEYLTHLEGLEQQVGFPITLINTMKSSALLMIYNLVESTMTNLLQDVFDHLEAEKVNFEALNNTMKQVVLTYSKKRSPEKIIESMGARTINLVVACFDRTDLFSGNIDSKKITDTLDQLGISYRQKYKEASLLTVKTERNSLAHGHKSFSDCGRGYTASDLRDHHTKVKQTLVKVAADFENFLSLKSYS
jgi:hypothetical protein